MAYLSDFSNSAPSSGNFPSTSSGNFPSSNFASGDYQRHFEDVDQSLSCAVCLVRFTEPRLLACNHTFCKICLEKILEKKAKDVDREKDQFDDYEIECPRCRKITRLGDGGIETLPKNYDLDQVVQAMPPEPTQPFVRQISIPMCSFHSKELCYYCRTDNTLVCADCFVENHQGHDFQHANKVGEEEKDKFRDSYFETLEKERQKYLLAVDEVSHVMKTLRQKGEKTKGDIQEHFQSVRDSLESRENQLVLETQKIVTQKVDKLLEQEKLLKEIFEGLDKEYEQCKRLMDATTLNFLKDKDKQAMSVKTVMKKAYNVERTPVESPSQGPYWHHPSTSLTDAETKSGVFCDSVSSMHTATGSGLTKAFVGKEATFRIEARDKYGNKSFLKGTPPQVTISGPKMREEVHHTIEQFVPGEYVISYTPSCVGWHTISIRVNGEAIKTPDCKVIVLGSKDYLKMSKPLESVMKSRLNFEPPVSTMRGVCVLPNGWIIFVDSSCLRVIDGYSGRTCQTIGNYGNAPGQFTGPYDVTLTPQNHIFVTDVSNHRVQRFAPEGNNRYRYVALFGSQGSGKQNFNSPEGIAAWGDERVFVADKGNNRIQVFSQKGMKHCATFGKRGERPGQFNQPRDVVVGPDFLLVSDTGNKRIQALTFDGKILNTFGGYNYLVFKPRTPSFIAIDSYGFILVTYKGSNLITVLTPQGEGTVVNQFVSKFLKSPFGICVDRQGNVVVTDSASSQIVCF